MSMVKHGEVNIVVKFNKNIFDRNQVVELFNQVSEIELVEILYEDEGKRTRYIIKPRSCLKTFTSLKEITCEGELIIVEEGNVV